MKVKYTIMISRVKEMKYTDVLLLEKYSMKKETLHYLLNISLQVLNGFFNFFRVEDVIIVVDKIQK